MTEPDLQGYRCYCGNAFNVGPAYWRHLRQIHVTMGPPVLSVDDRWVLEPSEP